MPTKQVASTKEPNNFQMQLQEPILPNKHRPQIAINTPMNQPFYIFKLSEVYSPLKSVWWLRKHETPSHRKSKCLIDESNFQRYICLTHKKILNPVLHCDKTQRTFENTREM